MVHGPGYALVPYPASHPAVPSTHSSATSTLRPHRHARPAILVTYSANGNELDELTTKWIMSLIDSLLTGGGSLIERIKR